MVKRAIAAMLSMVMILGVFSGLSISVQAANTKDVTLFSTGSTLASGITWTGTTQYSSNRGQLVHKNNGESATLTFSANMTGLEKITINAASAYTEEYTVKIGDTEIGSVSHEERKTSNDKLDFADYDNDIEITTTETGMQTVTITDVTQETYINRVTLTYSGEAPEEPDTTSVVIKSKANSKVIDVTASGTENGNIVIASDDTGADSQKWTFKEDVEKGWYYIVNKNSNKGIGLSGGATGAGVQPVQWDCDGSANQFWRFVEVKKNGTTYYKIFNKNSKRVLTVNNAKVTQEDWIGADNQLWELVPAERLPENFGSEYDDDYAVTNISASAAEGVISYKVIYTKGEEMTLKVTLSDGQEKTEDVGSFNQVDDGTYTITACVYDGENKVTNELTKTITLTDGKYSVVGAEWISSTEQNMYADNGVIETRDVTEKDIEAIKAEDGGKVWIDVDQDTVYQQMDSHPWGGCFNEMGWSVMRDLTEDQKKEVVASLFGAGENSLNFTAARMSIGSSDFGDDMYTFADKPIKEVKDGVKYFNDEAMTDDEAMENFSIERDVVGINGDGQSMMKYISTALDLVPDLEIFGSPWSPPAWMKQNNTTLNGIGDSINKWEEKDSNYEHYADYFVKFLDAYATALDNKAAYQEKYPDADLTWLNKNIYLKAITPQNEVTMDTPYPSCILNGDQHNKFIKNYLYPAVSKYNSDNTDRSDVEVWLGTFTDSQKSFAMPTIQDDTTRGMIGAACFQWWGAPLTAQIHMNEKYRNLKLVQSETKCGNSLNNWGYAEEQFDNFKEFLDAGVSQYHLWNMILDSKGHNNAMPRNRQWPQNAPITVDGTTVTYRPSYYLTKHFSSNVDANARRIKTEGNTLRNGSVKGHVQDLRAIAFQNPDGEIVLNVKNSTSLVESVTVIVEGKAFDVSIPAHSINTFKLSDEAFTYQSIDQKADMTETVEIEESVDVKLENAQNGLLLSSEGYDNGTDITTTTNRGEAHQTWSILNNTDNSSYRLKNFRSELVMCVWSGSKDENAKISQYTDTAAPDQSWRLDLIKVEGEGADAKYYYRIVNVNSNLALTALGTENDLVTQKKYTGADNQLWAMTIVNGAEKWQHGDPIDDTKITQKTYSFLTDTANSDGWINKAEWKVAEANLPSYFYIDTVEAGKIESITARFGYFHNSAELNVYTYDNNGEPLTAEQLKEFKTNQEGLTKIGSFASSKDTDYEYCTTVISNDAITMTENSKNAFVLDNDKSKTLDVTGINNKKAIVIEMKGNTSGDAYFDNVKIKYREPVEDSLPVIESVSGEGVKTNSVLIDKAERSITVPVVPGKLTDTWQPTLDVDYPATAELTDGTWKNGTITVTMGTQSAAWTIKCVEYGNPVLDGFYADPNIALFGDTFYIYPTTDGGVGWDSRSFKTFSSKDLVNWTEHDVILDLADVPWSKGKCGWAPTIIERNGKYYYYFSAENRDNTAKSLGVAVADSPTGPFIAEETPIAPSGTKPGQMIDPAVFIDDDGQAYLYWGNGGYYAAKLSDDMLNIEGDIETITPTNFREASFVIKRNGTYYFMWSDNDTGEPTYEVHYGTSDSPMGPIKGDTTILSYESADEGTNIKATGHHSVVNIPGTDEWYICYHRFNIPRYGNVTAKNSEAGNHREVCIDKMEFNADGSIKPVKPTLEGITEPVTVQETELSAKCDMSTLWNDGNIEYKAFVSNATSEYDLYIAIYDENGVLVKVFKNEPTGSFEAEDGVYTVKAMVWEKNGMKPLCDTVEKTVLSDAPKIDISEDNVTGSNPWGADGKDGTPIPNLANDAKKAADGRMNTFFDGLSGGYVTIDLGEEYCIEKIGFAPRAGSYNTRMQDGEFYGSNDGETWTSLYKINSAPARNVMSYAKIADTETAYKYIKYAVPDDETHFCNIAEIELYGRPALTLTDSASVSAAKTELTLDEEIYGNMYLPQKQGAVKISWESSDEDTISTSGEVKRGMEDKSVTLTATLTKGTATDIKNINVTVKAAPTDKSEADMSAYLFVHFVAPNEASDADEQIYFSVSEDGTTWKTLNNGKAVLTSNVGERGLRDPHIIRSPEGDKFFLIATDLSIYNRYNVFGNTNGWGDCQVGGSKSIVVFESTDLINWTDARLVKVARDDAGCAWAPESVYDDKSGRYMVFWASKTESTGDGLQRVYRSYTRDFINFTEPEMYIDGTTEDNDTPVNSIDTTFIKSGEYYYRFTKNEAKSSIIMEKGKDLNGNFEEVATYTLDGVAGNTVQGYEGPTAYKLNGEDKWCLLLDQYKGARYTPFVTNDISKGEFTKGTTFNFDATYCHGTVMPITQAEYDALAQKYGVSQ